MLGLRPTHCTRRGRWRDPAVDMGAELGRVVDALPLLKRLTLPGEWAIGWAGDDPSEVPAAATPLARLLLRCAGRAGAPATTLMVPKHAAAHHAPVDYADFDDGIDRNVSDEESYKDPHGEACFARVKKRVKRVREAAKATARLLAAGRAGVQPRGARLPRVEFDFCELDWQWADRDEASD
jgi:hypothetical protein